MFHFIREGGWPMFIVLLSGAASLGTALRYSRDGQKNLLGVAIALAAATVAAGLFGTVAGIMKSAEFIGDVPPDQKWIVWLGVKESLNNFALAMVFSFADALLITRGLWRRANLSGQAA
jgi:hypothetical protein